MSVLRARRPEARDPFAPGLLRDVGEEIGKVAVVRASRIGDFICATPALRALRHALPRAEITLIALPFIEPLAARSPDIDRFVTFPGFPGIADQFFDARDAVAFFREMQAQSFDLALQLHGSGAYANTFTLLLGAHWTAGFVRSPDYHDRLDAALPMPADTLREPRRWQSLTTFLGCDASDDTDIAFPLWPDDRASAAALLSHLPRPWIGLHPGARDATKRWSVHRFAQVAATLQRHYGGSVILLGSTDEMRVNSAISSGLLGQHTDLTARLSLPLLGAVIEHLDLLLSNDSAPAHIAYALGTPSVTVFGGTDPRRWGPPNEAVHRVAFYPVTCRPCREGSCAVDHACLSAIQAEDVLIQAEAALAAGRCAATTANQSAGVDHESHAGGL